MPKSRRDANIHLLRQLQKYEEGGKIKEKEKIAGRESVLSVLLVLSEVAAYSFLHFFFLCLYIKQFLFIEINFPLS